MDNTIAVIYVDPPDSTIGEGLEFTAAYHLNNPSGKKFDRIRLAIQYDRDYIAPLGVRDLALKAHLDTPSKAEVRPH